MAEKMTMAQAVRVGAAFNPLSAPDGQGEVFEGNAQTLLTKAIADHGWDDMRFVTEHQINAAGWTLNPGAEKVQITLKDERGAWGNRVLYNAEHISGIPSVEAMLAVAETRIRDAREEATLPFMVASGGEMLLYSADGKSALSHDYTGIVEEGNPKRFWYVSQDKGVRAIEPLAAVTYADAKALVASLHGAQGVEKTVDSVPVQTVSADLPVIDSKLVDELIDAYKFAPLRAATVAASAAKRRTEEALESEEQGAEDDDELVVGPAKRVLEQDDEPLAVTPFFKEREILREPQFLYAEANLLGHVFKERVPGSGEYVRGEEKKVAFIDKGASLVVRDKQPDCYKAVMELAKSKGWAAIELTGKTEHIAKGWLEAQLMGIEVANYTPGEKDLAALDARRAEMERKAITDVQTEQSKQVPDGATVVNTGRHIGNVVDIKGGYAIQKTAPSVFVAHDLTQFEKAPVSGEMMDVQYSREGKALVKLSEDLARVKGQEQEGGRGRAIGGR